MPFVEFLNGGWKWSYTGEISAVKSYRPVDCTTNPSLVLGAFQDSTLGDFISNEIEAGQTAGLRPDEIDEDGG